MTFQNKPAAPLPSPYYRVSVKAIVVVDGKLLVSRNKAGLWEIPGGGWEHGETMEAALSRELEEELHVTAKHIGDVRFVWRDYSAERGVYYLRLAVPVVLQTHDFVPDDGGLVEAKFVSRDEFKVLPFQSAELGVVDCIDKIWGTN